MSVELWYQISDLVSVMTKRERKSPRTTNPKRPCHFILVNMLNRFLCPTIESYRFGTKWELPRVLHSGT